MAGQDNRWNPNSYNYGTAAPAYEPGIHEETEKVAQVEKVGFVAEERKYSFRLIKNIAFFVVLFTVFSAIIARYSQISSKNLENQRLETNINEKKTKIELMNVSINEARDLAVLQKRAEEIGLGFADESQVRYINVEVPVEEMPETEEEGIDVLDVLESVRSVFG